MHCGWVLAMQSFNFDHYVISDLNRFCSLTENMIMRKQWDEQANPYNTAETKYHNTHNGPNRNRIFYMNGEFGPPFPWPLWPEATCPSFGRNYDFCEEFANTSDAAYGELAFCGPQMICNSNRASQIVSVDLIGDV